MEDITKRTREGSECEGSGESLMNEHKSKILKLEGRGELGEQLLPGILDEITLSHVAPKLPWTTFHVLSSVSHAWRQVIESHQVSHQVYDTRVRTQSMQTLLLLMNHDNVKNVGTLALFSLSGRSCCYLPLIPGLKGGLPKSCQISFLDGKLYVLGGLEDFATHRLTWYRPASAKVYVLDIVGQWKWKQCASMAEPRVKFGCGVVNGKIYALGGITPSGVPGIGRVYCGFEVYDPASDAWSPIAPMEFRGSNQQVLTLGEELFVHCTRKYYSPRAPNYTRCKQGPLEVYNPLTNQWSTMGHFVKSEDTLFTVGGNLYKLMGRFSGGWGYYQVEVFDTSAKSWKPWLSSLFSAFGSVESFRVSLLDIVAMHDELLCVVYFIKDDDCREMHLMRSHGFGFPNLEIQWQKTKCSLPFFDCNDGHVLCPIQL